MGERTPKPAPHHQAGRVVAASRERASRCRAKQEWEERAVPTVGTIAYARTCYRHMAGWFGVAVIEAMVRKGILAVGDADSYIVTPHGRRWLERELGITVTATRDHRDTLHQGVSHRNRIAFPCMDWTERRPHLAGWLGRALYQSFLGRKWVLPVEGSRVLRVTAEGTRRVKTLLVAHLR